MKILCLYNNSCAVPLFNWLQQEGHTTILVSERLTKSWCRDQKVDLTVSYTYRHILPDEILDALQNNVVNLHNSFLPWNRGSDPNLWSIITHTPRGVTLHYVNAGLDKGAIIAQQLVPLRLGDTLRTSYNALDAAAKTLFQQAFQWYPYWPYMKKRPEGEGSYHSTADGEFLRKSISSYDMTVEEFRCRIDARGEANALYSC